MKLEELLQQRSAGSCELCQSGDALTAYEVQPQSYSNEDNTILICNKCRMQIEKKAELDSAHWEGFVRYYVERGAGDKSSVLADAASSEARKLGDG